MKITFIRHSKTKIEPEKSIVLWGLADEGIAKARALSRQAAVQGVDVMYSSLQTKAIETMMYLAKPNAIPMRTHPDLTEITSFTNKFYYGEEYTVQYERYFAGKLERIAGGETVQEALSRFEAALENIVVEETSRTNIGIVSHGSILSFFTGKYADVDPFGVHQKIQQPDVAEFDWETKLFTRLWGE